MSIIVWAPNLLLYSWLNQLCLSFMLPQKHKYEFIFLYLKFCSSFPIVYKSQTPFHVIEGLSGYELWIFIQQHPWPPAAYTLYPCSCRDLNEKEPNSFPLLIPLLVPLLLHETSCQCIQLSNSYSLFKISWSISMSSFLPFPNWLFSLLWHNGFGMEFHYNIITGFAIIIMQQ